MPWDGNQLRRTFDDIFPELHEHKDGQPVLLIKWLWSWNQKILSCDLPVHKS